MRLKLLLSFFLIISIYTSASFGQKGNLTGEIRDAETNTALPGANVFIEGTNFGVAADKLGDFLLAGLPVGEHKLMVSYLGYQTYETQITIEANRTLEINVELQPSTVQTETVIISGIKQGQALALNQQKTADNIKNVVASDLIGRFPDPNVAEALQRIPGISVQRDQGEGRYIQIRGTNPNLSNISINGEQIPSPEGDVRFVALDMIPSDMLSSIEVSKAITPDMDGDAIGGAVNLNTLSLVEDRPFINATLSGGYNNLAKDISPYGGLGSLTLGQRFGEDKQFGILLGGSYNRTNRASNNNEMEYSDAELDVLELRDYELTRERLGTTLSMDYRFTNSSRLYLNGMYNYFSDQEFRRRLVLESDVIERELKDRLEEQSILSISGGGEHALSNLLHVDYMLSYSYADQNTPFDRAINFAQEFEDSNEETIDIVEFSRADPDYPQFSITPDGQAEGAGAYNYNAFEFDEFENSSEITTDKHFTSRLNLKTFYNLSDIYGEFKFGGLYRTKNKDRKPSIKLYGYGADDLTYSAVQGSFLDDDFLDNNYANGVGLLPDPEKLENFFNNNRANFEFEEEDSEVDSKAETYDAEENTYAGYAMTKLQKDRLSGIIGVRYEMIDVSYNANVIEFNAEGDLESINATSASNDFSFILPMIHLRYALTDRANLRVAWTNTFAKPNYFDLAPYRIINREDEEVELGNPDLNPTTSMNFDLMGEYYFSAIGVISAGVFYKQIEDFIYIRSFETNDPGLAGYIATQPVNGETADLMGFELNLQQQLSFLPGFFSGFGIYANYTYTWSEAEIFSEDDATAPRTISLPGQTEHVANFALSYENYGFSGRVSLHYAGEFIDEVRATSDEDRWYDSRMQLDVSLSQRITPSIQVFLEALNLTNAPLRYYNGISSRPEQQEFYSWWTNLGVKFEL